MKDIIDTLCLMRIGRKPDLENPKGYNDLIQWLKLYDQRPEHITCCDKWAVRDWVAERAGEDCLIPAQLGIAPEWLPVMMKCTHDSGSARMVNKLWELDRTFVALEGRLGRPYGKEKGEWAYQYVPPRILSEKALDGPITDYKFHCAHGEIRWAQIISDRSSGKAKETILSANGSPLGLHMDHKMEHCPDAFVYPGDEAWEALTALARKLADGWRYVRVDLYWSQGRAWFGELTFWPLAGCYLTKDEPTFGELLDLDLSYRMEPIA